MQMETYTPLELAPNWQDKARDWFWKPREVSAWEMPAAALVTVLFVVSVMI
jgi:hypothetical protein